MARRLLPLLLAALAVFSCGGPEADPRPQNVIFVLVDTLRADHLGIYGYSRATSPTVDAFARESVLFTDNRSQAACTYPSVNSILTSRSPTAFLDQPDESLGIPAGVPSLAEILQANGYRTVALSGSPIMRKSPSRFNPVGGFDRGFEVFDEECLWKTAGCLNRRAAPHLKQGDRPLFLYLHYMDPHGPYTPPKAFRRKFARIHPDKEFIRKGDPNPIGEMLYKGGPDVGLTPADVQHLVDLYDGEIAYFDSRFAVLLQAIRDAGLAEDSIVVFAADHGEEFLEHGHIKHCRTLYDTLIRTPLMLRVPGVPARAVAAPVQNLDIVPTLLDYLGIDPAGQTFEGRSLRPIMEGEEGEEDGAGSHQFAWQGGLRSASDGRHKLIHDIGFKSFELYDLRNDPKEKADVLTRERRVFHRLRETLGGWITRTEGKGDEGLRKSREAEEKLRALGYIE
jgi:arylsulfatase A-like enzyme